MRFYFSGSRGLAALALVGLVGAVSATAPLAAQEAAQEAGKPVVEEHGLGTGVDEQRNLVGRATTFSEGQQVWFWTRIVGGSPGQRIQHVWVKDGEDVVTIGLSLGGPHWRTWSKKWMHPGSAGSWRAEVRDAQGEVLASEEFVCTAPE